MVFYHGTTQEAWDAIQGEGILWGRRFIVDNSGKPIKEVDRCTYLAVEKKEAEQYGDVLLKVEYNPFNSRGFIRKGKRGMPLNNYIEGCWQVRVYEPIPLTDIEKIN